jgi:hypothetical protein
MIGSRWLSVGVGVTDGSSLGSAVGVELGHSVSVGSAVGVELGLSVGSGVSVGVGESLSVGVGCSAGVEGGVAVGHEVGVDVAFPEPGWCGFVVTVVPPWWRCLGEWWGCGVGVSELATTGWREPPL